MATLDPSAPPSAAVAAELRRRRSSERWAEPVPDRVQLPGMALLRAMPLRGARGASTRLPSATPLVGYAGLGAGVHDSGTTDRDNGSTKPGRRELGYVRIAAARAALQSHPDWKLTVAPLEQRMGEPTASVAIARTLLIGVWHVRMAKSADRRADAAPVAFKLMVWAGKLTDEPRGGVSARHFIRAHLIRLGRGAELTHSTRGGTRRPLATREAVRALRPAVRGPPHTACAGAERQPVGPVPAEARLPHCSRPSRARAGPADLLVLVLGLPDLR